MINTQYKFVDFKKYCKLCKHEKKNDYQDPCNECLEVAAREGSEKPEYFEEKK
jgi:hypothetical protein